MKIKEFLKEPNGSYILQKVLKVEKTWLYLNDESEVPKEALDILNRVKSGYPVEYVFEEVYFYGDKFFVKEGVLIPRDDTEIVVEHAIKLIKLFAKKRKRGGREEEKIDKRKLKSDNLPLKVVDCCTGSGVIAIEIAKHTDVIVKATDISDTALEVAKKNAKLHNVEIEFKKCDLFNVKGDILVSNPPYVENSWEKPNRYEPDIAFYGGDDGLDIVKEIILRAKKLDYKAAVIEIGYNQKQSLSAFLKDKVQNYEFFKDLAGNIRGVKIIF